MKKLLPGNGVWEVGVNAGLVGHGLHRATDSLLLDVTDDAVRALRAEALTVGDEVMARVCADALSHDATVRVPARREVALAKIESMNA